MFANQKQIPRRISINWNHVLSRGLVACYLPGIAGRNLALDKGSVGYLSAARATIGIEGPGLSSTAANSGMTGLAADNMKTANLTLYWRGYVIGNSSANSPLVYVSYDNVAGSPFAVLGLAGDSVGTTNQVQIHRNNAGSFGANNLGAITTGAVSSYTAVNDSADGSTGLRGYKNGVSVFSGAGVTPNTSATSQICINTFAGAETRFSNTVTFMCLIWNRALSTAEVSLLEKMPYAILGGSDRERIFGPGIGASGQGEVPPPPQAEVLFAQACL